MLPWCSASSYGCDLHTSDTNGVTLIHQAAQQPSSLDVLRILVSSGLNVNLQDRIGRAPIHFLATYCVPRWLTKKDSFFVNCLRQLLAEGADPNIQDGRGWTIAHILARNPNVRLDEVMLEILLEANVDFLIQDDENKNPMEALAEDRLRDMTWLATGASQCVDIGVARTWFALKKSLDQENLSEFELLLEKLPPVDFAGQKGYTAINLAVIKDRLDAIEILVKRNANINACDEEGKTPLMYVQKGKAGARIVEYLCTKDADVLSFDDFGETALGMAVVAGDLHRFELLCRHGAAFTVNTRQGCILVPAPKHDGNVKRLALPLHAAAIYSGICGMEMVRYLHSKGANLEALDESGRNVMHYIARSRGAQGEALKIVKFLLLHGVEYQLKDNAGKTPLDLYEGKSTLPTYDTRVEDYLRFGIQLERPKDDETEDDDLEMD